MSKKYLWIGMSATDEKFEEMSIKGYKLASAHVSQKNLIQGIENLDGIKIDTINGYVLPPYPLYKEIIIKEEKWSHNGISEDVSVRFKNIKYYNHVSKTYNLCRVAKKWALKNKKEEEIIIFIYSMHYPFIKAATAIKKILPQSKIYLIVPDLPQFMDLNMNYLKKMLKKIDWYNIRKNMKYIDKYILYTKEMANFLKLKDNKWILMEGSINIQECKKYAMQNKDIIQLKNEEDIIFMYSGVLDLNYGIPELLNAFQEIENKNYKLWFTGAGNAENLIRETMKKDNRIELLGFLPSREEVLKRQQRATFLINMRNPHEEASKYCFPSKIFEYMLMGKPVLSTKILGIPEEYFKYLIKIEDLSKKNIIYAINKVAKMSEEERKNIGIAQREFITEKKNNDIQSKKIIEFIEK